MGKLILVLFFLFFLSCQRNTNPIVPGNKEQIFPTAIGTTWTYSFVDTSFYIFYHDSFTIETDTINVEIVNKKVHQTGKTEIVWLIEGSENSADSIFVTYYSDTLFFLTNSKYFTWQVVLVLPLQKGKTWKYWASDYEVSVLDSLKLPFDGLKNLFVVKQFLKRECNSSGKYTYYIKEGIGIIKFVYHFGSTMGNANHRKVWQLLNYSEPK